VNGGESHPVEANARNVSSDPSQILMGSITTKKLLAR
jgi:hypothetical protein